MDIPDRLKPMAAAANARAALTAKHYDAMTLEKPGRESPDDPKPIAIDAIQARARAIQSGRLIAPPRDEWDLAEAKREAAEEKAADERERQRVAAIQAEQDRQRLDAIEAERIAAKAAEAEVERVAEAQRLADIETERRRAAEVPPVIAGSNAPPPPSPSRSAPARSCRPHQASPTAAAATPTDGGA